MTGLQPDSARSRGRHEHHKRRVVGPGRAPQRVLRCLAGGRFREDSQRLRLAGAPARARRAPCIRGSPRSHRDHPVRRRRGARAAGRTSAPRDGDSAASSRGQGEPRAVDGRGRARRVRSRGPLERGASAVLARRAVGDRRGGTTALPVPGPPDRPHAAQPQAARTGEQRAAQGHGAPGIRRGRDPDALDAHAGRGARVRDPVAAAAGVVLRIASKPPNREAVAHGGRHRPLLPDRALHEGRGSTRGSPVRVHPARHRGVLRGPSRGPHLCERGRDRSGLRGHRRATTGDSHDDVERGPRQVRDRQAGPAVRDGARRSRRGRRGHGVQRLQGGLCAGRSRAGAGRGGVAPEPSRRACRARS